MQFITCEKIIIRDELVFSEHTLITLENIEGSLKDAFIEILRDNSPNILRSYDLKNAYIQKLNEKGIDIEKLSHSVKQDKNYVQIFKNLTGSNVKNTTHFLRSNYVNWFYARENGNEISDIVAQKMNTTELPKDFNNIKKGQKKYHYFVFYNDQLDDEVRAIGNVSEDPESYTFINDDENDYTEIEILNEVLSKTRNSKLQKAFKEALIKRDKCKCSIESCKINNEELLVASHIIPVKEIVKTREFGKITKIKLIKEASNGLLLCANHDRIFDRGFISFDDNGYLIFNKILSEETINELKISTKTRINKQILKDLDLKRNLNWHREYYKNLF